MHLKALEKAEKIVTVQYIKGLTINASLRIGLTTFSQRSARMLLKPSSPCSTITGPSSCELITGPPAQAAL
jgi:hypothetical protein